MPDLPTLTLSQAHFDRVVAVFAGATLDAKAAAYRAWLTNRLIDRVESSEMVRIDTQINAARADAWAAVAASLPPRVDETP